MQGMELGEVSKLSTVYYAYFTCLLGVFLGFLPQCWGWNPQPHTCQKSALLVSYTPIPALCIFNSKQCVSPTPCTTNSRILGAKDEKSPEGNWEEGVFPGTSYSGSCECNASQTTTLGVWSSHLAQTTSESCCPAFQSGSLIVRADTLGLFRQPLTSPDRGGQINRYPSSSSSALVSTQSAGIYFKRGRTNPEGLLKLLYIRSHGKLEKRLWGREVGKDPSGIRGVGRRQECYTVQVDCAKGCSFFCFSFRLPYL